MSFLSPSNHRRMPGTTDSTVTAHTDISPRVHSGERAFVRCCSVVSSETRQSRTPRLRLLSLSLSPSVIPQGPARLNNVRLANSNFRSVYGTTTGHWSRNTAAGVPIHAGSELRGPLRRDDTSSYTALGGHRNNDEGNNSAGSGGVYPIGQPFPRSGDRDGVRVGGAQSTSEVAPIDRGLASSSGMAGCRCSERCSSWEVTEAAEPDAASRELPRRAGRNGECDRRCIRSNGAAWHQLR